MKKGLTGYWPIIDGHADTLVQSIIEERKFFQRSNRGHLDLPRLVETGVDLQILAICSEKRNDPYQFALSILEKWENDRFFQENSDLRSSFIWIRNKADFAEWERSKKVGVLLALEGAEPLEGRVDRLEEFYRRGIRILSLTWNLQNEFACGVGCETDTGLTALGKEIVRIAQDMGYLLDLSHLGYRSFFDLFSVARNPVIASHANIFDLCPHQRNLKKEQLQAIADIDGTVGLTFYPPFIAHKRGRDRVGIEDIIIHLEYLLERWGDQIPALGGDFDGIESTPYNLQNILELKKFVGYMEKIGIKKDTRERVLGGNLYRILRNIF